MLLFRCLRLVLGAWHDCLDFSTGHVVTLNKTYTTLAIPPTVAMHTIYDEFDLGGLSREEAKAINAIAPVGQRLEDALANEQLTLDDARVGSTATEMKRANPSRRKSKANISSNEANTVHDNANGGTAIQTGEDFQIPMR